MPRSNNPNGCSDVWTSPSAAAVGEDRPSHLNLAFDTCASAGCHNYHDNRALYEDFLVEHGTAEAATF